MSETKFQDLYIYLKTFLNDLNDLFVQYNNDQLDSYIQTYVAFAGAPVKHDTKSEFTTDLGSVQAKALLSAKVAIMVLENEDAYGFSTKIYGVRDSNRDLARRVSALKRKLEEFEDGALPVETIGDWRSVFGVTAIDNTINDLDTDLLGN